MNRIKIPVPLWVTGTVVLLFLAYAVIQYGIYRPEQGALGGAKKALADFPWNVWVAVLYFHIVTGALALAAGPVQFLPMNGAKRKRVHRAIGMVYALSIFLSIPASVYLSFYATGGMPSTIAFLALNAVWLIATGTGLRQALARRIASHREWMLRSYAVTLVFVTFRIIMPLFSMVFGLQTGFPIAVWTALAVNMLAAEGIVRRKRRRAALARLHVPTVGIQ